MELLNYLLTSLVLFISPFIGLYISHETKEELFSGKKYFHLVSLICFIAASSISMFSFFGDKVYLSVFIVVLLAIGTGYLVYKNKDFDLFLSFLSGVVIFFGKGNPELFFMSSGLLVLMFISNASIIAAIEHTNKKKDLKKEIVRLFYGSGIFLTTASILFFLIH